MTERLPEADVAIVGLGAAGGIAAHVLTAAGLDVVGLEAGPRLTRDDHAFDEIRNDARAWLARPKALHEQPTWREDDSVEAGPSPWPTLMMNAVGGTTVHYDGLSIRFLPWNFHSRSAIVERYGASAVPEGSTLADWPLAFEDLEPFYDRVEWELGVSGADRNPYDGPRTRGFPMPPMRSTGWGELVANAASNLGWHPFPAPAAINSQPWDGRGECTFCGFCQNNVCHQDAKGSTNLTSIARAEATGLLRIETGARVLRVETDDDGLARGVRFVRDGETFIQPAKVVLVGTYVYENTRLLLLSRSKAHPDGIGNDRGQVGRNYMAHVFPMTYGRFPGRRLNLFNGNGSQVTCVDDFNADNFDHSGEAFVGGGMITNTHELAPLMFARGTPHPPYVPRWGSAWKAWMKENAQSVGSIYAQFDALPYEDNRLDLDPVKTDPHGVPVVRVTHRIHPNEHAACSFIAQRQEELLREMGAAEIWNTPGPHIEGRHCAGGTRMGDDPDTSVVDGWGLAHDTPNLGVLGASVFPSVGGSNPTLTVQAVAWRTAEHIVEDWGAIARS
jgi:gluconate 2-dehydrogenase alpha chain